MKKINKPYCKINSKINYVNRNIKKYVQIIHLVKYNDRSSSFRIV